MLQNVLALAILGAVPLLGGLPGVSAQATTDAVCFAHAYDWTFNSLGQSPCLTAAYAQSACTNGDWNVPQLPTGYYYSGPDGDQANPCICSTPVWSLISACDYCQNQTTTASWKAWSANCTKVGTHTDFPKDIPVGTKLPGWAFLKVPTNSFWDPVAAKADANAPESTPTHVVSTVTSLPSSSSVSSSVITTSSTSPGPVASSGGLPIGGGGSSTASSSSATSATSSATTLPAPNGGAGAGVSRTGTVLAGVVGVFVGMGLLL